MTRVVLVQDYLLRDLPGRRAVEVDADTGRVLHVIAPDYQVPSVTVAASRYALLHGLPYDAPVSLERAA